MPYLTDVKGFTNQSVANDIFPVSIYASLVFYLVAGPVSRRIGLKTFVLLGATCKLWTRILLVWGTSLGAMQSTQVLFAAGSSADAILLAYAYAVARKDDGDAHPTPTSMPNPNPPSARPGGRYRTARRDQRSHRVVHLAALFGQIAYESGASYASPFRFSPAPVRCVLGASPERDRPRPGPFLYTARPSGTTYAPRPTRTPGKSFTRSRRRRETRSTRRRRRAKAAAYDRAERVVGPSAAPASFLEWYGTNLFDVIDGDADVNGYVVFFARLAMTAAAWAGGSEGLGAGTRLARLTRGFTLGRVRLSAFARSR